MATQLNIINRVQRRLREDQTASVATTEYSVLLADFLNDIIAEMNEAHDWSSQYHTVEIALVQGQLEYNLALNVTGGGAVPDTERVTNLESEVATVNSTWPNIYLYEDSSDTKGGIVTLTSPQAIRSCIRQNEQLDGIPDLVSFEANADGGLTMITYPDTNTATRRMKIEFFTPTPELEVDGTNDATDTLLPAYAQYLGVLYLALNERGEELGEPGSVAERRYYSALGGAKMVDSKVRAWTNAFEAHRD